MFEFYKFLAELLTYSVGMCFGILIMTWLIALPFAIPHIADIQRKIFSFISSGELITFDDKLKEE